VVDRIRLIRAALSTGFTIEELARILALRDDGGAPCMHVRKLAGAKLKNLERHIQELVGLKEQLRRVIKQWDKALKKAHPRQRARLLEILAAAPAARRHDPTYPSLVSRFATEEAQQP
jgi:DNA-binding transcriptional MerR regulator